MKRLACAEFWLPLGLLVLAGIGSYLLQKDRCVHLSERDRTAYGQRPAWQARFDALSAACGVGLLTYDLKEDYTPLGRWVLAGLGIGGALLYLAAARQITGRLWAPAGGGLPSTRRILLAFLVLQILLALVAGAVQRVSAPERGFVDGVWYGISAFSSFGQMATGPISVNNWMYTVLALLGGLGWMVWLLPLRRGGQHGPRLAGVLGSVISYVLFLAVAAAVVAAFEVPRGKPQLGRSDPHLTGAPLGSRYARSFAQVACAAGAGLPTEEIADRGASEGTKLVLAGVILTGSPGGSPGGGMKWTMLLWVLIGALAFAVRRPAASRDEAVRRCAIAGAAAVGAVLLWTLVVTLGLLLIEVRIVPSYQTPPTLADALLEASSATAGAGLSTGLTATLTSANLSRGIQQNVDLYQYGMWWLMLAMFVGRVLPVWAVGQAAGARAHDARPPLLPVL